ncbi:MAG: Alkaline phosphatase [Phycisphaerales bacterium]|nr:Alkaline phosphatase [Phycisphaerales bacterium]
MKSLIKRNSREAVRLAALNVIEPLEARAYLTGVVLGSPINLATAAIGVTPMFANLTPSSGGFRTGNINADLFIANQNNTVSVLLGNGNGTFAAPTTIAVSGTPLPLATGDFNGDGKLDIIAGTTGSPAGSISVILGNGDGTFQPATNFNAFASNHAIAVGHFVDGGPLDVVSVTNTAGAGNNVGILFGNGTGGATGFTNLAVLHGSIATVAVGNFGNGHDDIVIVDQVDNKVTVILGNGDGTFQAPVDYSVGAGPVSVALGAYDTNANNNLDIVTANSIDGTVSFLPGNGNGTFGTAVPSTVGGTTSGHGPLKVRDTEFNGDGKRDLLLLLSSGGTGDATVMLGNGDGTFHTGTIIKTNGHTRDAIAAGDLNGDGLTDAVVSDPTQITSLLNITQQDAIAPTAAVDATQAPGSELTNVYNFTVTYTDNQQIDATTLGDTNLVVSLPGGGTTTAKLLNKNLGNAASIQATYQITFGSNISAANNGVYGVTINANSVKDAAGNPVAAGSIGSFTLAASPTQAPPTDPNPPAFVAPSGDLTLGAPTGKLTTAVVGGSKFKNTISIPVTNTSGKLITGNVVVTLYSSSTQFVDGTSVALVSAKKKVTKLKNGKGFVLKVKNFTFPSVAGTYFLVAAATVSGAADSNNSSTGAISVAAPFVDVNNLNVKKIPVSLIAGKTATVSFTLRNDGNVTATGTSVATVSVSGPANGNVPTQVAAVNVKISLKPGQSKLFTVHFKPAVLPTTGAGYNVSVAVALPGDTNAANNTATSAGTLSV